ncbi:MAG: aconitate hydratase AcnA [Alphaproteobacteria bacterium]
MAKKSESQKSESKFNVKSSLKVGSKTYSYYDIKKAEEQLGFNFSRLPFSLKVVLENLLRKFDGKNISIEDIRAVDTWQKNKKSDHEISFYPARVLMQDFTGVPAVVDLATMRDAVKDLNGNPKEINPLTPVDLVIDHSVMVDSSGKPSSFKENVDLEMERNIERYQFLKWGQGSFENFKVVPPGTGICHQVNLEYLAQVVWSSNQDGELVAYPDTLVGTDSHTTMINGLSVLGWGVGGIEAEAVMLGQPLSFVLPEVIGFKLTGELKEGVTATDLVLTITNILREYGVVNKFVEFFGSGLDELSLADRATVANMAPEYGATCGIFPIDAETIKYLELSARDKQTIKLVEKYAKLQGMWRENEAQDPIFTDVIELDLSKIIPCVAGPKRPQDKINLGEVAGNFSKALKATNEKIDIHQEFAVKNQDYKLQNGSVVIAAITSCTNTSNPSVMIGAGLLARKAVKLGLKSKPFVKTSLAPGSQVVTEYLRKGGLDKDLDKLGFNLVGYGCTTCIGNSGPIDSNIENAIKENNLEVASVLSGNRNFEGRVHPSTKANYLMSPLLVVAYAIAGNVNINLLAEPLGFDAKGREVYLKDIWPSNKEIAKAVSKFVTAKSFKRKYKDVFAGTKQWQEIKVNEGTNYSWDAKSTYIRKPNYFDDLIKSVKNKSSKATIGFALNNASILALLGDSITTDHISPAGNIEKKGPAAKYLKEHGVDEKDFNSYGARRGNHEVMLRGTFANIRIKNEMAPNTEGGVTTYLKNGEDIASGKVVSIFEASELYKKENRPLVVIAGKEYGTGSSRDWAAKGSFLLGVRAVIAESFERIHRSNLVGMGVLPLTFQKGESRKTLNLKGSEKITILGLENGIKPKMLVDCKIDYIDGTSKKTKLICRIDTEAEVEYFANGGILHNMIKKIVG